MNHLRWTSLFKRRSYHKAKLVFRCLNSLAPSYFLAFFIRFSNIHSYSTRQSNRLLLLHRVKSNFAKNTFPFSEVKIYKSDSCPPTLYVALCNTVFIIVIVFGGPWWILVL